jgi:uncharacterized protein YndB with AHSA1/START domain
MTKASTRHHEHEIIIDAPIEAVWKAITDAEELTRWFVEAAKVDQRVGGHYWVSWGGEEQGESVVQVWEPNKRFKVALLPFKPGMCGPGDTQGEPIVEEYTLESRGGKTVLRLVNSGIPASADWDGFYNGTEFGWKSFFRLLRHYLEHAPGKPRKMVKMAGTLRGTPDEAWKSILGPQGFNMTPRAGERYSITTGSGEKLSGQVVFASEPAGFELTIDQLDNAFFAHSATPGGATSYYYDVLSLFGYSDEKAKEVEAKWSSWIKGLIE